MQSWSVEKNNKIWIPSILNFNIGIYYPIDQDNEMKWAFAPIQKIPEEDQKNYPIGDGKFYDQKYDTGNQIIFDKFDRGIVEINMIMEIRSNAKDKNGEKSI